VAESVDPHDEARPMQWIDGALDAAIDRSRTNRRRAPSSTTWRAPSPPRQTRSVAASAHR